MVKEVTEVFEKTDTGTTDPLIGIIDKKQVIIKISKNPYGPRVLINEFVCLEIAKLLELPIAEGGICSITKNTNIDDLMYYELCLNDVEGLCFYSEKLDRVIEFIDLSPELANKVLNKNDIVRLILFDHFIHNKDRHDGNVLLCYAKNSNSNILFNIIDHSHVFNMMDGWAEVRREEYNEYYILEENEDVYRNFYGVVDINLEVLMNEARIFKDKLNRESILNILNKIPCSLIQNEEKESILGYLLHRLNIIDEICKFIYEKISCSGGEVDENSFFCTNI